MFGLTYAITELFNQMSSQDSENSPGVSYSQRDIIEIAVDDLIIKDDTPELGDDRVINFQSIIQSGEVSLGNPIIGSYEVDWEADDLFNQRMNEIEMNVTERVSQHDALQGLVDKPEWTNQDRVSWEFHLSEIVSEEVNKISGFEEYRSSSNNIIATLFDGIDRESRANEISRDLETGGQAIEFDCELMAIVEGSILQRVENTLLPEDSEQGGDYKEVGNYFYAQSQVSYDPQRDDLDEWRGHVYIISSVTGNIIEATADPDDNKHPYRFNVDPNFSFEKFVETGTAITNGGIYYTKSIELEEAKVIQSELVTFEDSKADILFEYIEDNYADLDIENAGSGGYDPALELLATHMKIGVNDYEFMVESYESLLLGLEISSRLNINEYMDTYPENFAHLQSKEELLTFIEKEVEKSLQPYRESFAEELPEKDVYLRGRFSEAVRDIYEYGDGAVIEGVLQKMMIDNTEIDNAEVDVSTNALVSMGNADNQMEELQFAQPVQSRLSLGTI
tara:strand:- start:260394 stop:261914 length:1521 start_codon:yes stop_codon:yes gene_type:complete